MGPPWLYPTVMYGTHPVVEQVPSAIPWAEIPWPVTHQNPDKFRGKPSDEDLAVMLRERGAEAFAAGEDDLAQALRNAWRLLSGRG